jgi:tRNA(fMet)-specific endonuclease VapC
MKYMLDANVLRHLAAHDVGYKNIILNIQRVGIKSLFVSVIVAAELHKAINNHKLERAERKTIQDMLNALSLVHFDEGDAEVSGEIAAAALRKGRSIPVPDYLIAGHALNLGFVMVTDNTKHFDAIEGLTVENWRKPLA